MTETFAEDWLTLREPADRRARDAGLLDAVVAHLARSARPTVTDLACGSGATLRALADRLGPTQAWRLVDHDPRLLEAARRRVPAGIAIDTLQADLGAALESVIALEADLIATSAFLDLVSDDWIARLVSAAAAHRRPVYAALSYDGRVACTPADPLDADVLAAFDLHQRRDKGLGGALGPAAAQAAARRFAAAGYAVVTAAADWAIGPDEAALQARLLRGWHGAVAETGRIGASELDAWLARRLAAVAAGTSRLGVGHTDLWARPGGG